MELDEMIARLDAIEDRILELFRDNGGIDHESELSELDAESAFLKELVEIERQGGSDART